MLKRSADWNVTTVKEIAGVGVNNSRRIISSLKKKKLIRCEFAYLARKSHLRDGHLQLRAATRSANKILVL